MRRAGFFGLMLMALALNAATTNYVSVVGNVMQGQGLAGYVQLTPTNLPCSCASNGTIVLRLLGSHDSVYWGDIPHNDCGATNFSHGWWSTPNNSAGTYICNEVCTNTDCLHHYLLWLMANTNVFSDLGITPAADGDLIVQQNDQSGHGYNVIGGTAHQPMFITNAANTHPAVRFQTGGDNALDNTAVTNGQPIIVYMVLQITNVDSPGNSILWASDNASGSMRVAMNTSHAISMVATAPGGGSYTQIDGAALFPTNRFNLITCIFNGAASSLRQNGTQIASGTMHNSGLGGIAIQGDFAAPDDLEEFIVDTDPTQMGGTEAYLTGKYGL